MKNSKLEKYCKKNNQYGGLQCNPQIDPNIIQNINNMIKFDGNYNIGFMKIDNNGRHIITKDLDVNNRSFLLGSGSFGSVYKGTMRTFSHGKILRYDVAIKEMILENIKKQENLCSEIIAVANLSHPNIIKYHGYANNKTFYYVFMEYINGIELYQHLTNSSLSFDEKISIAEQLLVGLDYMHINNVYHRDIKPENIMIVKYQNNNRNYILAKYIDFGFSCQEDISCQSSEYIMGTPIYFSPEYWQNIRKIKENNLMRNFPENAQFETKNMYEYYDLWALGCTLYELFSDYYLFYNDDKNVLSNDVSTATQENINQLIQDKLPNVQGNAKYNRIKNAIIALLKINPMERTIILPVERKLNF
jgi:serine/threonine protein kinase